MAARRRVESAEIRFGPALKALASCLLIGGAAVGYVLQQHELSSLSVQLTKATASRDELRAHNQALRTLSNQLTAQLALQVRERRGDLGPTRPGQVLTLALPSAWPSADAYPVKLAAGGVR